MNVATSYGGRIMSKRLVHSRSLKNLERRRTLFVAVVAVLGVTPYGAAVTWNNNSGNRSWSTASNWSSNVEPGSGDVVTFPAVIPPATLSDQPVLSSGELA